MKYYIINLTTKSGQGFTYAIDSAIAACQTIPNSGVFRENALDGELERVF